ncbi:hypothetical protein K504DRAFT_229990 [Pleomassaria siparia CBS 279.74]|uniref:Uncharacterized protein n=1 Tax=Pleomassaria siparia CBS 279.74 TaxID=1314801 RepID=A0A6G1KG56_9PLEO|nr:hypothetical protein K504DRAFT_229990 [Pleomassaria siparia CBS 279.74]
MYGCLSTTWMIQYRLWLSTYGWSNPSDIFTAGILNFGPCFHCGCAASVPYATYIDRTSMSSRCSFRRLVSILNAESISSQFRRTHHRIRHGYCYHTRGTVSKYRLLIQFCASSGMSHFVSTHLVGSQIYNHTRTIPCSPTCISTTDLEGSQETRKAASCCTPRIQRHNTDFDISTGNPTHLYFGTRCPNSFLFRLAQHEHHRVSVSHFPANDIGPRASLQQLSM